MSTAKRNQEIRSEALRNLYAAGQQIGASVPLLWRQLRTAGFDYSPDEIAGAALFLGGQGFAEKVEDPSSGVVRFVITSRGVLHYEAQNP